MALNLKHQTPAEFAARFWTRLRAVYQSGDRFTFMRMIWWLHRRVQSGDFIPDDLRLSFNAAYKRSLTVAQWNTFMTSTLEPIRDRYQAMLDQADL